MARQQPVLPGLALILAAIPPVLIATAFLALVVRGAWHGGQAAREEGLIALILILFVAAAAVDAILFLVLGVWSRLRND